MKRYAPIAKAKEAHGTHTGKEYAVLFHDAVSKSRVRAEMCKKVDVVKKALNYPK